MICFRPSFRVCSSHRIQSNRVIATPNMSAPNRSELLQTVHAFIAQLNGWTSDSLLSLRSPSANHTVLPASLHGSKLNNEQFQAAVSTFMLHLRGFRLEVGDHNLTVIDVEQRRVALHLKAYAESDIGPYQNEYIWIFTVTEDGTQIENSAEFIDSAYTAEFMQRAGVQRPE